MNLGFLIIERIKEGLVNNPEMSFGEILYSICREKNLPSRGFSGSERTKFLRGVENSDFLAAVEKFLEE